MIFLSVHFLSLLSLLFLSQSRWMLSTEKMSFEFKVQSAELWNILWIFHHAIWSLASHLLGLSHLGDKEKTGIKNREVGLYGCMKHTLDLVLWELSANVLVRFLANGMPSCGQEMPPNTFLVTKGSYESKSDVTRPPTHLQVLSLSSSWRALQSASEFLQEHWQVRGFWMNNRFLLAKQPSQHGSHWL